MVNFLERRQEPQRNNWASEMFCYPTMGLPWGSGLQWAIAC